MIYSIIKEPDMEDRIIELETRMIYAENTIDELNKTIAAQNTEIDKLRKFCLELKSKVDELRESGGGEPMEHSRPPHY